MKQGIFAIGASVAVVAGVCGAAAQPMPIPASPPGYYDSRAYYPPPPPMPRYAVAPPVETGMPSYEVARVLRQNGFMPLGGPSRRGDFYSVSAIHPNGDDGRVVIDAYTGRVVRFVPASRFIRDQGSDEMVMVYRGPTFPPPDADRGYRPPPPPAVAPPMGARAPVAANPPPVIHAPVIHAPASRPPQVASRTPAAAPVTTPKPRPQAAPKAPATAQAPPAAPPPVAKTPEQVAPVAAPPPEAKPVEATPATPAAPAPAPTQAMPPVQTME